MAHMKIDLDVPDDFNSRERREFAKSVIDFIKDRTDQGLDRNNRPFPEYSPSYIKSLAFKSAGKSASKVDLQLSGSMLAGIRVLETGEGYVTIGFKEGSKQNDKAEGNILGTYGQSTPRKSKARDFLGLTRSDYKNLLDQI